MWSGVWPFYEGKTWMLVMLLNNVILTLSRIIELNCIKRLWASHSRDRVIDLWYFTFLCILLSAGCFLTCLHSTIFYKPIRHSIFPSLSVWATFGGATDSRNLENLIVVVLVRTWYISLQQCLLPLKTWLSSRKSIR